MAKFYRTLVSFTVLSEEPIDNMDIGTIVNDCQDHHLVMTGTGTDVIELDGKQMADELYDANSEPGFFQLDDDGNPTDEFNEHEDCDDTSCWCQAIKKETK